MTRNKLFQLLSLSTLIVLVLSALFSAPALADSGSTPPGTGTTSGGRTSSKGSALSQLPSGTKVVIVDSAGDKLPLGSQAAQDIVTSGDPIWCPSTVSSPIPFSSGCSGSYGSLWALTSAVQSGAFVPVLANSTIWILDIPDNTGNQIILNSSVDSHDLGLRNFTLTFKGGWTGVGGSISSTTPSTINNAGFSIAWNNSVTMSNIVVDNAPAGQDGIYISTPKNITLTNVQAENGNDHGAYLVNTSGNGTVTISNSTFINNNLTNYTWGLVVYSNGAITMTNDAVDSDFMAGGASLDNCNLSGGVCT
ncbi:MAG TPA: right-handed parallel beta-helix repeat-containing protein, partial [Anaerolineales bacterium]|nr:right-handed parallel beta-helix repeat-containing protein [Anaerolineales bacterium]